MPVVIVNTNLLCGAILSNNPGAAPARVVQAWLSGSFELAVSPEIEAEYRDVLNREPFRGKERTNAILARLDRKDGCHMYPSPALRSLAPCRDPKDQKFFDLGASQAQTVIAIVSNDDDVLEHSPKREVA